MIKILIDKNSGDQRLDRFLKKYYNKASLGQIYKMIRKDVKVNGRRAKIENILAIGDELTVYISEEESQKLREKKKIHKAKRQFIIAYEDKDVLVVEKPFGLLTHGDKIEKKNTLANQVIGYLIEQGEYNPRGEQTFKPSPVNRLDRNTTGLVIFGKNAETVKSLNKMIRERDSIEKYYFTIVVGEMNKPLVLRDNMEKDFLRNMVKIVDGECGKHMETVANPIMIANGFTFVEVQLITGRSHQIRVHLANAGHPIIGDVKYGKRNVNDGLKKKYDLNTQLLHANRLIFNEGPLKGKEIVGKLPEQFEKIKKDIFSR